MRFRFLSFLSFLYADCVIRNQNDLKWNISFLCIIYRKLEFINKEFINNSKWNDGMKIFNHIRCKQSYNQRTNVNPKYTVFDEFNERFP